MPTSRLVGLRFSVLPRKGACGTPGVSPRRRGHELLSNSRGTLRLESRGRVCPCGSHDPADLSRPSGSPRDTGRRLRSARGWTCRSAACPQELPLSPTRRLVRTDCRPDTHLNRPPDPAFRAFQALRRTCLFRVLRASHKAFAPAFIALPPRLPNVPSVSSSLQARHRSGHPHPALRDENGHDAAPRRAGWAGL
jgi:hypothetical protein